VELSKISGTLVPTCCATGEHLITFRSRLPGAVRGASAADFWNGAIIHREVRKLYADAELPRFAMLERRDKRMVMLYESPRHFADLAEGLISGCARHYGERLSIVRENLASETGSRVRFVLERQ
jgi:hypothetical protein